MVPHWIEAVAWLASWPFRRLWVGWDDRSLGEWADAVTDDEEGR